MEHHGAIHPPSYPAPDSVAMHPVEAFLNGDVNAKKAAKKTEDKPAKKTAKKAAKKPTKKEDDD